MAITPSTCGSSGGFWYSMDTEISVQTQDSTQYAEKFAAIFSCRKQVWRELNRRLGLESRQVDPTPIRSKWNGQKSGQKGKRMNFDSVSPIRIWWTTVAWSDGMWVLLTKHSSVIRRRENSFRKKIRHSIPWSNNTIWSRVILSSMLHKRQDKDSSIHLKRPHSCVHQICHERGRRLDRRSIRGRWRTTGEQRCFRCLRQEDSKQKKWESKTWEDNSHFPVLTDQYHLQKEVRMHCKKTERRHGIETWFLEHIWKLHLSTLCQELRKFVCASRGSCPIPFTKVHWCYQTTQTNLNRQQELYWSTCSLHISGVCCFLLFRLLQIPVQQYLLYVSLAAWIQEKKMFSSREVMAVWQFVVCVTRANGWRDDQQIVYHLISSHWCHQTHSRIFGRVARAQNRRLLECRLWTTIIWILVWIHKVLQFWRNPTLSRRTYVGRRHAGEDPNYVLIGWNLSRNMVDNV